LVAMTWHTQHREMHGMDFHNDDFGDEKGGLTYGVFAYPAYELFQKNDRLFSSIFAYQGTGGLHLTVGKLAEVGHGEFVSGEYFNGVGIAPAAGRLIVSSDDSDGAAQQVAVLSFASSRKWFGEASNAIGQSILINNIPFSVIGVTPPEFFGVDPDTNPDFYL